MAWQVLFGTLPLVAILLVLVALGERKRPLPASAPEPLVIERGDWLYLFGPDRLDSLADLGTRVRAGTLGGPEDGAEVTHA